MEETLEKCSSNCPSCGIEHSQHSWGLPSCYWEGNTGSEPIVQNAETAINVGTNILTGLSCSDNKEEHLLKELQEFQSRREELEKRQHQTKLCAQVDHEGCALADLQEHLGLSTLPLFQRVHKSSMPSNNSSFQLQPVPYKSLLQKIPCCHQPLWMCCWLTCIFFFNVCY